MRYYLRKLTIAVIAFYASLAVIPTVHIGTDPRNILYILGGLMLASVLIKPIFNIVLLPANFITYSILTLVINLILVFAFVYFLHGFSIEAYTFPGADINGFIIPTASFNKFAAPAVFAASITLIQRVLQLIFR